YAARSGCVLVINDRVDVAVALRCWGVQLTSHSLPARDVRRIAPVLRIGVSAHSADGAGSVRGLADWILAGHVFPTASHPGEAGRGLSFISAVVQAAGGAAGTPVVAIGGVTPAEIAAVRSAGARGVA